MKSWRATRRRPKHRLAVCMYVLHVEPTYLLLKPTKNNIDPIIHHNIIVCRSDPEDSSRTRMMMTMITQQADDDQSHQQACHCSDTSMRHDDNNLRVNELKTMMERPKSASKQRPRRYCCIVVMLCTSLLGNINTASASSAVGPNKRTKSPTDSTFDVLSNNFYPDEDQLAANDFQEVTTTAAIAAIPNDTSKEDRNILQDEVLNMVDDLFFGATATTTASTENSAAISKQSLAFAYSNDKDLHSNSNDDLVSNGIFDSSTFMPTPITKPKTMDEILSSIPSSSSSFQKLDFNIHESIRLVANSIIHDSAQTVSQVLRGDVAGHVPTEIYGQTIHEEIAEYQEHFPDLSDTGSSGNNNNNNDNMNMNIDDNSILFGDEGYFNTPQDEHNNNYFANNPLLRQKLYGGAQYHRLLQCYHEIFLTTPISQTTEEEVSLLLHGISDSHHDGKDLLRSVAILSSKRMDELAFLVLRSLARRIEFVLCRMWDIVQYTMITRTLGFKSSKEYGKSSNLSLESLESVEQDLLEFVKQSYHKFVKEKVHLAFTIVSGDINALMRFVSWDLAFSNGNISGSSLSKSLSSSTLGKFQIVKPSTDVDNDWDAFLEDDEENDDTDLGDLAEGGLDRGNDSDAQPDTILDVQTDALLMQVMQSVQETTPIIPSSGESLQRTYTAVNTLVQHVTTQWRFEIFRMVSTKFNSFCVVSFHDEFGPYLRKEMNQYLNKSTD